MTMRVFDNIKNTLRKTEALAEVILLTCVYYWTCQYAYQAGEFVRNMGSTKFILVGLYFAICIVLFHYSEGLKFGHLKLANVLSAQWISLVVLNVLSYFVISLAAGMMVRVTPICVLTGIDFAVAFVCVYLFTAVYHHFYVPRKMMMVYGSDRALPLKVKMDTRSDQYQIKTLIHADEGYEQIISQIPFYDAVVISDIPAGLRNDILKFCYKIGKRTYVTPKISDVIVRGADEIHLFDTPLMLVRANGLDFEERFIKRAMDIVLCLIALAVIWPFMLMIALAIKLEDGGPVFYRQRRCTRNNEEFDILKFRSMIVDAEKEGKSIPATDHDPRITKVGRVIRALRVDELPQILNILSGKMSIVGPRPERIEHVLAYTEEMPEFAFRSKVKGGLTGYAQVYGKYNTTPYDKLKLDLTYIENYSFMLDCKLILMTVATLFKKESTEGFDKRVKVSEETDEKEKVSV